MDPQRVDALSRVLVSGASRRLMLAGLLTTLVAHRSFASGGEEALARHKKKHNLKRRPTVAPPPTVPPPPSCTPNCERKICGDDGCGGTCGECAVGFTCDSGHCLCASPRALMCGGCIDLLTDSQHCGLCSVACDNRAPVCFHGMCCESPAGDICQCALAGSACDTDTCCTNGPCLPTGLCP